MAPHGELSRDMLFQLNTALLASMPQPEREDCPISPVFLKAGFRVHAIGPTVEMPRDIIPVATQAVSCQRFAKPDLVFADKSKSLFILFECKASSFSAGSSNSEQARTLLICSGTLILEVLGQGIRGDTTGGTCYLVGDNQGQGMLNTLTELSNELSGAGLDYGFCAALVLSVTDTETVIDYDVDTGRTLSFPDDPPLVVLRHRKGFDPRSLYLILFDPSHSDSDERQKCLLMLRSKILRFFVTRVGEATTPSTVVITVEDVMHSLFSSIIQEWRDKEVITNTKRQVGYFFETLTNQIRRQASLVAMSTRTEIRFELKNDSDQANLLVALQKADPYAMKPAPDEGMEPLFDI